MPVITVTGMQIGNLIAFALVTETVFQWPGMGLLFIQAVTFVDIPVMAAYWSSSPSSSSRSTRWSTCSTPWSIRGCARGRRGSAPMAAEARVSGGPASGAAAALDSDLGWSFRRTPAPWRRRPAPGRPSDAPSWRPSIAPQNPYDLAALPRQGRAAAGLAADGEWPFLLGTDPQGRDVLSAILYGIARLAADRPAQRAAVSMTARRARRADRRLLRRRRSTTC